MGMLDGKVALITGGARGQGRAHAVTCAREGADVIIVDVIDQLPTVAYKLATKDDLEETVRLVESYDRRAIALKADVRAQDQLDAAVAELAGKIVAKSPYALAIGKEAFYRQAELGLAEAYAYANQVMTTNMLARDAETGIDAFIAKQPMPKWQGR